MQKITKTAKIAMQVLYADFLRGAVSTEIFPLANSEIFLRKSSKKHRHNNMLHVYVMHIIPVCLRILLAAYVCVFFAYVVRILRACSSHMLRIILVCDIRILRIRYASSLRIICVFFVYVTRMPAYVTRVLRACYAYLA